MATDWETEEALGEDLLPPELRGQQERALELGKTEAAVVMRLTEELELPEWVNRDDALYGTAKAIRAACRSADPDEHPIDSDFKGSLKAKLTGRP